MRLDKFLANSNVGTRKEVKGYIQKGQVKVNDEIIKKVDYKVSSTDLITYNGESINYEKFYYYILNKPEGVVSSTDDKDKTVIDLIESPCKGLFPVGRLDKDTEGLLLITNNGKLAHNMLSPKKHVFKTYYAEIEGVVEDKHIQTFKDGVIINGDYKCKESKLTILKSDKVSEILIEISEGKFHQVKKMFRAINCTVKYLKRVEFGGIKLCDELKKGDYRVANKEELIILKKYM